MRAALSAAVLLVAALAATAPARGEGEVSLDVRLSQDTVRLGDALQMQVLVRGVRTARGPDASDFGADLDVRLLQEQEGGRTETVIVQGRLTSREEVWYGFVYELRPARDGEIVVPSLVYSAAGEELRTEPVRLHVLGPRPSEHATLTVRPVPDRVYVEQPIVLELRVHIARLSLGGRPWDADPFLTRDPPELRIPWIDGTDDLAAEGTDAYLDRISAPAGVAGFALNGLARRTFFGGGEPRLFRLGREAEERDGRQWFHYTLRREVVPLRAGRLELPASFVVGDIVTGVEETGGGAARATQTETVFVTHDDVVVEVRPVPEEGRPPTYSHAVGRFLVEAAATPTRAQVGDPVTLTLRVDGRRHLDRLEPPRLAAQVDLVADFTVEPAAPPSWDGASRVFTYTLRPRRADVTHVPPLRFASFDPFAERFVEQTTEPIPLDVEDASEVTTAELEMAGGTGSLTSTPGAEIAGGLAPNAGIAEILSDEPYEPWRSPWLWLAVVLPPLALVGALLWRRRQDAHDDVARRAREALPDALAELDVAREAERPEDAAAGLFRALAGFVAARTARPAAGLTAAEVGALLTARGTDEALVSDVVSALSECEASRYGGAAGVRDRIDAAEGWLRALDRELPV